MFVYISMYIYIYIYIYHIYIYIYISISISISLFLSLSQYIYTYIYTYMLIKTEYTVIFNLKMFRQQMFLSFTTLHVYNSYLQVEIFIVTIFYYYIKRLLIIE